MKGWMEQVVWLVATPIVIGVPYFVGQVVAGDGVAWAFATIAFAAFVVASTTRDMRNPKLRASYRAWFGGGPCVSQSLYP